MDGYMYVFFNYIVVCISETISLIYLLNQLEVQSQQKNGTCSTTLMVNFLQFHITLSAKLCFHSASESSVSLSRYISTASLWETAVSSSCLLVSSSRALSAARSIATSSLSLTASHETSFSKKMET